VSKIIVPGEDLNKYEPIKQGPIAKMGGYYKYFDNKLGNWVYQYIGPEFYGAQADNLGFKYSTAKNFYEVDDIKQGRVRQEPRKPRAKKGRKP